MTVSNDRMDSGNIRRYKSRPRNCIILMRRHFSILLVIPLLAKTRANPTAASTIDCRTDYQIICEQPNINEFTIARLLLGQGSLHKCECLTDEFGVGYIRCENTNFVCNVAPTKCRDFIAEYRFDAQGNMERMDTNWFCMNGSDGCELPNYIVRKSVTDAGVQDACFVRIEGQGGECQDCTVQSQSQPGFGGFSYNINIASSCGFQDAFTWRAQELFVTAYENEIHSSCPTIATPAPNGSSYRKMSSWKLSLTTAIIMGFCSTIW